MTGAGATGGRRRELAVSRFRGAQIAGGAAVAVAALFFALPLIALATRITPLEMARELGSYEARSALVVSLAAVAITLVFVVVFGTPTAYALARGDGRISRLLEVLFDLPLVLPPAVAGIALLAAFGSDGLLGGSIAAAGLQVPFTRVAVVIALAFVAGPLYVRQAQVAFAAIDSSVTDAARTSGTGPFTNFLRIELPLARYGLVTGLALCGARALGEFGATIMFAGSVAGVTQTVTLAIYGSLDTQIATSFALATVLLLLTVLISLSARGLSARAAKGYA